MKDQAMEEKDGKDQHERGEQLAITERKVSDLGPGSTLEKLL